MDGFFGMDGPRGAAVGHYAELLLSDDGGGGGGDILFKAEPETFCLFNVGPGSWAGPRFLGKRGTCD